MVASEPGGARKTGCAPAPSLPRQGPRCPSVLQTGLIFPIGVGYPGTLLPFFAHKIKVQLKRRADLKPQKGMWLPWLGHRTRLSSGPSGTSSSLTSLLGLLP